MLLNINQELRDNEKEIYEYEELEERKEIFNEKTIEETIEIIREHQLLEEAKSGDEEAVGQIFDKYKNFVFLKARNYFLLGAEREDLIQEGMIGLLKAIRGYDKNKLASFRTFASICIKRQLITAIKTANSQKNMALNFAVGLVTEDKNENNKEVVSYARGLESYISYSPEELYLTKEQIEGLRDFLKINLSEFEYTVFNYMVVGLTYKDIAKKLSKKIKSVDNAIQRIKRKSGNWLENYQQC